MQPGSSMRTPTGGPGGGVLPGARMSHKYFDATGVQKRSAIEVPVDGNGELAATGWRCRPCGTVRWLNINAKGTPVCEVHDRKMVEVVLKRPPLLPYGAIWEAVEPALRPVWVGTAVAVAGQGAHAGHVPGVAAAAVALPAGWAAARWSKTRLRAYANQKRVDRPTEDVEKWRRTVGYCTAAGCLWTALAATTGVDPHHAGGVVSLATLGALWLPFAATWWRHLRQLKVAKPAPVVVVEQPDEDEDEVRRAEVVKIWNSLIGVNDPGQQAIPERAGMPAKPARPARKGKLAGTWLEDVAPSIDGWDAGWTAVAVGDPGQYSSEDFIAARSKIAGAYHMATSMVECLPDPQDENRARYHVGRQSRIKKDIVRWAGPDSIDVYAGTAPVATYSDNTPVMYEIYRPEWGSPHDILIGTTGAAKSETLSELLIIDRWAHYRDEQGQPHGIVCDILIDPQAGQSFGPFLDDLAAPVATTIAEAMVVVEAFANEMHRRNRYLANVEWFDEHGRRRKGRKWWNPLTDGPILTLNIDEAHEYLSFKPFLALVVAGARMYRKCGMKIRVATHTPLLDDLGGSMTLRDMLSGGFVWCGRTANSLSGTTVFNGRMPVDPSKIPEIPGLAFIRSKISTKPMLARSGWEPDWYDWIRDEQGQPIGYPAPLPPETLEAFGPVFADWAATVRAGGEWVPPKDRPAGTTGSTQTTVPVVDLKSVDAVDAVLRDATRPMDVDEIDKACQAAGSRYSTRTLRDALKKLRDQGLVYTSNGRHELTPQARATATADTASFATVDPDVARLIADEGAGQ